VPTTDEQPFDDTSAEPGAWRYVHARRSSVIVDAADYFAFMHQAMLAARERILLIGWDFDTRIHLAQGRRWWQRRGGNRYPARLGSFIPWLARHHPQLEIRILKWSVSYLVFAARGTMVLDLLRWAPHKRIDFKFDSAHPPACSHHQKIVVLDDALAVCGGIDMTDRRWDTREHLETDERRKRPHGALYGPWHDVTMMIEGEAAAALGELGRERWRRAGGSDLQRANAPEQSAWPERLEAQFEDVEIGIARTRAEYGDAPAVHEIEKLFLEHIARAKRFIYAESQYFASRKVAEALAKRLTEDDPPEVVLINPLTAEGWLEPVAMDSARARLLRALDEVDRKHRFHIYVPHTGKTPIYVHAKLMIVDDEVLRIGSANLNNRSLGLDSEADVFIDCARPANAHCCAAITALRHSLLAEHCGLDEDKVSGLLDQHGSMAAMIAALGSTNRRWLKPFEPEELSDLKRKMADAAVLDPERPDDMFEPFAEGRGLFRKGSLLRRARDRIRRREGTK
jgi:phosphatidylserine/phosphatidylglycerophosphate/cardiolipin synthase-like enzyme